MKLSKLKSPIRTISRSQGSALPERSSAGAGTRKRFYDSKVWQDARAAKLRRDPLCQCCAVSGLAAEATHVDHWQPLAQGGHPTADGNLVSMCTHCHSRKTLAERNGTEFPRIVPSKARSAVMC